MKAEEIADKITGVHNNINGEDLNLLYECLPFVKKDIAELPDYDGKYFYCKGCNSILGTDYRCDEPEYCSDCGQKIRWDFNIEFDHIVY